MSVETTFSRAIVRAKMKNGTTADGFLLEPSSSGHPFPGCRPFTVRHRFQHP